MHILKSLKLNSEIMKKPLETFHESEIERIEFTTECPNQWVWISLSVPFSGHIGAGTATSTALRIYLDGSAYYSVDNGAIHASYWNGTLVANSGTFPDKINYPQLGHLSRCWCTCIPDEGLHFLTLQSAGGTLDAITTIKSQRDYVIWTD